MSRYIPGSDDTLHKQTRFVISTDMAMQWLDIYANENGDKLPTSGRILLPSSTTMTSVYQEYTEEYNGSGYVISKASFFRNWKKVHGNISIPKAMINKALLKTHIIGGLTHGHGEFPQDSNLTLSILLSILNNINRKEHRLPDTLYLQMDNCSRENKNKYVYGVLGYLVLKGIFRKVRLSFLPVGHTHEDIDQMFSRFSSYLNKNDAVTPGELMEALRKSYSPEPDVHVLEQSEVFDFKAWIEPHLEEMHNHVAPKHFIFKLVDGSLVFKYKYWATDPKWEPYNSSIQLFTNTDISPTTLQSLVPNISALNLSQVVEDIDKLTDYTTEVQVQEWKIFCERMNQQDQLSRCPFTQLVYGDALDGMHVHAADNSKQAAELVHEEGIACLLEKEVARPEVYNGVYRPKAVSQKPLCEGDMVAVLPEKDQFTGKPWIGLCETIDTTTSTFVIQWYKGSYTTAWRPDKTFPNSEIHMKAIIAYGFTFTSTSKLNKKTIDLLKECLPS
eukprot:Em0757g1a